MKNRSWSTLVDVIYFFLGILAMESPSVAGNCFGCCARVANGTLTLTHQLPIKNTSGKSSTISAGRYEANFKLTNDNRTIGLEIVKTAGSNQVLELPVPDGVLAQGDFVMRGAQIGQDFDVMGQITETTIRTPSVVNFEYCSWRETVWVGRPIVVVRHGTRRVVYHNIETTYNNRLEFQVNSMPVGVLQASRMTVRQFIEHIGGCY